MAVKLFQKKAPSGGRAPWRRRVSLRWALVLTTVLCALGAFLLIALESWGLEWARDALYLKYITPYYADEMETGEYYSVSPDGTLLYVEATMPYAYVDPDTGEIYPIETTSPTLFIPAGPLRFFYKNVGQIALCAFVITAALAFLADAWWFYHWKIKKPLAILNQAAQKIGQSDLDFHVESPSADELGKLCQSFETMRASLEENNRALWDAVEERKRLNAAFSHDLRTPLTVLQGYSDLLLDALPSGDLSPEKTVDTVLTMKRSLTRLQRYVESMNSLQRLEDVRPQKSTVPFSSLCAHLWETGEILGKGDFSFSSQGDGSTFLDTELLFQVYENLLQRRALRPKAGVGPSRAGGWLALPHRGGRRARLPARRAETGRRALLPGGQVPLPPRGAALWPGAVHLPLPLRKARGLAANRKQPRRRRESHCTVFCTVGGEHMKKQPREIPGLFLFVRFFVHFSGA